MAHGLEIGELHALDEECANHNVTYLHRVDDPSTLCEREKNLLSVNLNSFNCVFAISS
jgi:hypothetical protein